MALDHADGVTETVDINPADGLRRPQTISTSAGWWTSLYDYDGAGNVKKIGAQDFRYDGLSRPTLGEADTGQTQTIAYDSFGNITSMTTGGVFQSLPTSVAEAQPRFGWCLVGVRRAPVHDTGNVEKLRSK